MKDKIKPVLTVILLVFVGVTLIVQIAGEFRSVRPIRLPDGLNVICTHATMRCPTCLMMAKLTREMLNESFKDAVDSGKIIFAEIDYEHPETSEFCEEYQVATASVVLVHVENGKTIAGVNLADEMWKHVTNPPIFKKVLKEQIESLRGEK